MPSNVRQQLAQETSSLERYPSNKHTKLTKHGTQGSLKLHEAWQHFSLPYTSWRIRCRGKGELQKAEYFLCCMKSHASLPQ
jgi:hypothetical protein